MNKRFQVFVSSTYTDLREERQEVMQALLELDGIPAGMEVWPSTGDDSWTLIKRMIKESDYYLVVIGGKYGSTDADGVSFTEREYDYAVEVGKPVMAFVHGDEGAIATARAELDAQKREALSQFRAKLHASRFCRSWTSIKELGGLVSRAFAQIKNTHPAPGWVHASEVVEPMVLVELARAKEEVMELKAQAVVARHAAPPGADGLSQGSDVTVVHYSVVDAEEGDKIEGRISLSWNQILSMIGPVILDPVREEFLRRRFVEQATLAAVRRKGVKQFKDPWIFDDDFQRIKIQFCALGLTERAPRPEGDIQNSFGG